jgi:hypothetical protein
MENIASERLQSSSTALARPGLRRYLDQLGKSLPEHSTIQVWAPRFIVWIIIVWVASFAIGFETSLTILVLTGLVASVIGLRSPAVGLLGVGMLVTIDPMMRVYLLTGGLLRWNSFNYLLLLVILLNLPFLLRLNDPHSRLLQVLILLLSMELLISSDIQTGLQDLLTMITTFGLIVYIAKAHKQDQPIFWMGLVNGILAAIGGLFYYLMRSTLPYIDPNAWGFFPLGGLFSICLAYSYTKMNQKIRLFLILLAVVLCIWIFLSGSRGNTFTGLCCLVYLFLASRAITWKTLLIASALLLGLWISIQFINERTYAINRIEKLFNPQFTLNQRTSGRWDIALAGWDLFLNNPLGVGTGGFRFGVAGNDLLGGQPRPAHSAWVKILAENGILGFLILTAYVISFSIVGVRKRNQEQLLLGLLMTTIFAVNFISHEFQGKSIWFMAAATTVLLHPEDMIRHLRGIKRPGATRVVRLMRLRQARKSFPYLDETNIKQGTR